MMLGKKHSEETKKKMSIAHLGKKFTEEHRMKIALNHKRPMLGKKHSSDWKKNMSDVVKNQYESGIRTWTDEKKRAVSIFNAEVLKTKRLGDIGPYHNIFFRSKWELLVAKKLDEANIPYQYESEYFVLENGRTYTPDFKVDFGWIEVKGILRKSNVEKMNMFVESGKKLFIIDGRNINDVNLYDTIPWVVQ
jgi:hypothetical protein